MVGHSLNVFERAAVGKKIREAGRAKGMAALVGADAFSARRWIMRQTSMRCIGSAVSAPPCQSAERTRCVPFAPNSSAASGAG